MKTPELRPETLGIEKINITTDEETGIREINREIGGETVEITLKNSEGQQLSYINLEEISKIQDQERILKMMGIAVSPAIAELIQNDKKSGKYYIKFLPPDDKK